MNTRNKNLVGELASTFNQMLRQRCQIPVYWIGIEYVGELRHPKHLLPIAYQIVKCGLFGRFHFGIAKTNASFRYIHKRGFVQFPFGLVPFESHNT